MNSVIYCPHHGEQWADPCPKCATPDHAETARAPLRPAIWDAIRRWASTPSEIAKVSYARQINDAIYSEIAAATRSAERAAYERAAGLAHQQGDPELRDRILALSPDYTPEEDR